MFQELLDLLDERIRQLDREREERIRSIFLSQLYFRKVKEWREMLGEDDDDVVPEV